MIPNPTLTMLILTIFGVLTSLVIMLLPAFYELKKPKDAGPRRIMSETPFLQPKMIRTMLIVNMEEDYKISQPLIHRILDTIAALPNLES